MYVFVQEKVKNKVSQKNPQKFQKFQLTERPTEPEGYLEGGLPLVQATRGRGYPLDAPGSRLGWGCPLGASFGLLESSVLHIFYMIFLEFSEHFYF